MSGADSFIDIEKETVIIESKNQAVEHRDKFLVAFVKIGSLNNKEAKAFVPHLKDSALRNKRISFLEETRVLSFSLSVLGAIIFCLLQFAPCLAKGQKQFLTISPDLVVKSCQLGKFNCDDSPTRVPPEKVQFTPSKVSNGGCYGYRIKLRTSQKQVKISEQFELFPEKSVGRMERPVNGIIYRDWPDTGIHKGPHWIKLWINDVELPTLRYTRE